MKRLVPAATVTAVALLLSACGASPAPSASASTSASSSAPQASASTGPAYDPCAGLDVAAVTRAFGWPLKISTGTAKARACGIEPRNAAGPKLKFTISYLWFAAGLDQAWKTVKPPKSAAVTEPTIAHADATRLVAYEKKSYYAVTAFVQTGKLIQEVNGFALKPYDAAKVDAATTALMTALAAKAPRG